MSVRHCAALLIAAPASGQGKTSFTAALARLLHRQGRRVRVFKTGPDFLDPQLLARASGAPVGNLDLWMGGEYELRAQLHAAAAEAELILVEGMMGLFDGAPSAADLAERLGLPVLAVIDANALAQTFGALALGLQAYRPELRVFGAAANRVASGWHAQLLRDSLPPALRWCGALPECVDARLPERHLGLVSAGEVPELEKRLDALADALASDADLLAALSPEALPQVEFAEVEAPSIEPSLRGRRIAIARDAAFCFVYPANLEVLQQAGAELRFFSPLAGERLPECEAVWLPGGYPELHLERLAQCLPLWADLHAHAEAGRPMLAECGGMLSLLTHLEDSEGRGAALAGLLPGRGRLQSRLAGLGLQQVDLGEGRLRGHSFHYARADIACAPIARGQGPDGAPGAEAVYRLRRLTASFIHFYFPSSPRAACALFED